MYADPFTKKAEAHSVITSIAIKIDVDIILGDFNTLLKASILKNTKRTITVLELNLMD